MDESNQKYREQNNQEVLISRDNLSFDKISINPVLKPVAQINELYNSFELVINRALYEYQEINKEIKDMVQDNERYKDTIIYSKFMSLIEYVKQIIHSQDIQKDRMKYAIREMIRINNGEYVLKKNANNPYTDLPSGESSNSNSIFPDLSNITGEKFHSDLIEKDLPVPEKQNAFDKVFEEAKKEESYQNDEEQKSKKKNKTKKGVKKNAKKGRRKQRE